MVSYPNRLFKGWCSNEGNPRSHILHYNIYTVRNITDYAGGTILEEVLETPDLKIAIDVVEQLTGNMVKEDEVYH